MPKAELSMSARTLSTPVPANALPGERGIVELGDVVSIRSEQPSHPIFRRNGRAAEMVMGELAGVMPGDRGFDAAPSGAGDAHGDRADDC